MGKRKQSFMEGALILMMAGVVVKIIGAVFKIPLHNILGGQAMSYFSTAYDVYVMMYTLTTAGLAVAISRMVAECNIHGQYKNAKRILQVSVTAFFAVGLGACAIMYVGADFWAGRFGNPNAAWAIRVIAPAVLFEILLSIYRGYFQGHKDMLPTAITQIIASLAKLGLGMVVATAILNSGLPKELALPYAAAGAVSGVTLGSILGVIYLMIKKAFFKAEKVNGVLENPMVESGRVLLKKMIMITVPIALGSAATSITNFIDGTMVIPRLLASGQGQAMAETLSGTYSGMARTLFSLPSAVIGPIGISLIPVISEKIAAHNRKEASDILGSTFRIAILLSVPAGFGFIFMAQPILNLLYGSLPDEVLIATPLLTLLGPSAIFVCLVAISNAILQAAGRERAPMFSLLVGGTVKIISTFTLVAIPTVNIYGAPVSTFLCYSVALLLNIRAIKSVIDGLPTAWELFSKPILGAVLGCGGARLLYAPVAGIVGEKLSAVLCICVAMAVYFVAVIALKMLKKQDILLLPKGETIYKIFTKFGWTV